MSPSTPSFESLRESNMKALAKAGNLPGVAAEAENKHARIAILLDRRAHIEDLASGQSQRQAYGIEKFHKDFTMLRTCQSDPNSPHEGEHYRNFIWSCVPHCPFKRFQELFCHRHQFVVPHFTIQPNKRLWFDQGTNFHQMSLAACQVSPDRISDDFAQSTGLCTFEEGDSPLVRLEKKKAAVPTLKLMFESAVPLQQGHQRLLQVETPHPLTAKRYGTSVPEEAVGSIVYTREHGAQGNGQTPAKKHAPPAPRHRIVSHFTSAYAALRKTAHERSSYDTEQMELLRLKDEIAALNRRCNREWRGKIADEKKDALVAEAQEMLTRGHQLLEHCVNRDKCFADTRIGRCGELLTKHNVSAAMATMVGALNHLAHRLEDVAPKEGHNDQDRITLQRHITEQELLMKELRRNIEDGGRNYTGNAEITNATQLGIFACDLSRISLQPLRTYADRISQKIVDLDRALLIHDEAAAQQSLVQMHVIGKFQAARTCFEHIKHWMVDGRPIPLSEARQYVDRLHTIFAERSVYPECIVAGYSEAFNTMAEATEELRALLQRYTQQPIHDGAQTESIDKHLHAFLDRFDIEAMVRALP